MPPAVCDSVLTATAVIEYTIEEVTNVSAKHYM
nr:MAG TPA: hypothetical protein [Caudoviricetes sp.]